MSWRWSTGKAFVITRARSLSKRSGVWVPRAQGHCLFLREPRFLQGKLSVSQRGSKHSFVEGERPCSPAPPLKADVGSQQAPWAAVSARASPGPRSPLPGPARPQAARPTPDRLCAHFPSRRPCVLSAAERPSSLALQAWPQTPPPPGSLRRLTPKPGHPPLAGGCLHTTQPPSHPGPGSVSLPTWRPWRSR